MDESFGICEARGHFLWAVWSDQHTKQVNSHPPHPAAKRCVLYFTTRCLLFKRAEIKLSNIKEPQRV